MTEKETTETTPAAELEASALSNLVMWQVDNEKTEDHWLELVDPNGWYKASVKWDGCVHFNRLHNMPLPITEEHPQLVDYIHYCDIDEEIKRLQELKKMALTHFGEEWE